MIKLKKFENLIEVTLNVCSPGNLTRIQLNSNQILIFLCFYTTAVITYRDYFVYLLFLFFTAWIYASIAILIISLCGLSGVAIIPLTKTFAYNEILKFLISLAVGTLCGDALMVSYGGIP